MNRTAPRQPPGMSVRDKTETDEWAAGLKQSLADVKAGRVAGPMTGKELLAYLNKLSAEKDWRRDFGINKLPVRGPGRKPFARVARDGL